MTLTIGTGPFGDQGDKTFNIEVRARLRAFLRGLSTPGTGDVRRRDRGRQQTGKALARAGTSAGLLLPERDVRMDLLEATDLSTHCPVKGDASYWSVRVGDSVVDNVVWGYPDPIDSAPPLADYLAFLLEQDGDLRCEEQAHGV